MEWYVITRINKNHLIFIIGKELIREKSSEIDGIHKEHQRQIQVIAEDHRKEVDVSSSFPQGQAKWYLICGSGHLTVPKLQTL